MHSLDQKKDSLDDCQLAFSLKKNFFFLHQSLHLLAETTNSFDRCEWLDQPERANGLEMRVGRELNQVEELLTSFDKSNFSSSTLHLQTMLT